MFVGLHVVCYSHWDLFNSLSLMHSPMRPMHPMHSPFLPCAPCTHQIYNVSMHPMRSVRTMQEKARYKVAFEELRGLKGEIEHLHMLLEQSRVRLQRDFDGWLVLMGRTQVCDACVLELPCVYGGGVACCFLQIQIDSRIWPVELQL